MTNCDQDLKYFYNSQSSITSCDGLFRNHDLVPKSFQVPATRKEYSAMISVIFLQDLSIIKHFSVTQKKDTTFPFFPARPVPPIRWIPCIGFQRELSCASARTKSIGLPQMF